MHPKNLSSDPCQLKSTTAESVEDQVIDINDKNKNKRQQSVTRMDVTPTIHEVDDEEEDVICEPVQKASRRGGVSAEAIDENELDNYEKKVKELQIFRSY